MAIELKPKSDASLKEDLDSIRTELQEVLYELSVVTMQLKEKQKELETRKAMMIADDSESKTLEKEIKDLNGSQSMLAQQAAKFKGDIQKAVSF